ncbi:MAG: phosphate uptake regulator PhoU [Pyrobaculum sp.]|uniref:Phosphate uptake regulator, PhoU n=2 Tax=Pyrobaculum arsenaticum TaxID=121277 RepID=A4WI32_PYRAR|nr:phosphate uptake regulator PhoU [Pyrobaculum arsenaticum]ABP50049.1 phosphate uptake regulator, PhoU [Pyrobaculum arsenaticum DSM 13514]MCY0889641.1 phosphate uptake regulator PhoU [Pyrobaculum arsenaticum]NYR14982.1 phosphate uptake regulator PhoU [Pyrobaculum arsenaticum]
MRRLLDIAEEEISRKISHGAKVAIEALDEALKEEPDVEKIRKMASTIHDIHHEISDLVMEAVARYGPVASDLRFLKSALFISYDIYRVARYALDVATVVRKIGSGCWSKRVAEVGEVVKQMVARAVDMFLRRDASGIREVEKMDDEIVDKAYEEALLDVLRGADRCKVAETVVLRLLERASDHAVYIANHAWYLVTGEVKRS